MDLKVYTKEEVKQPNGNNEWFYVPNIIDIYPILSEDERSLNGAEIIEGADETEQMCALATIWQKGLDPVDVDVGVRWSEALLEEINVVQLMEDIMNAVAEITPSVTVVFDTITDANGNEFLTYKLQAVA